MLSGTLQSKGPLKIREHPEKVIDKNSTRVYSYTEHTDVGFKCNTCEKVTITAVDMKQHIEEIHIGSVEDEVNPKALEMKSDSFKAG